MLFMLLKHTLKYSPLPLYALLFGLCALAGSWAGAFVGNFGPLRKYVAAGPELAAAQALPANGQRNLLVIGVDRLDSHSPRLEGLWLVMYFPGRSPVTWHPLYPGTGAETGAEDLELEAAFALTEDGAPAPDFMKRLARGGLWWSGYVLLDGLAASTVLEALGGVVLDGQRMDGAEALGVIPPAWQEPRAALAGQANLLQAACRQAAARGIGGLQAAPLMAGLDDHLRSDLDLAVMLHDWNAAAGREALLRCEFPPLLPDDL